MTKKFGVWAWQHGEGCDYMIGCGSMLVELDATNLKDAIEEAKIKLGEEHSCYHGSERELQEIQVVQIMHEIDPTEIIDEEAEAEEEEEAERAKEERRLQFEALKREFE